MQIGEVEVRYIVILQQDGHNLVILTERPHRIAVGGKGYPLRHTTATHTYSLTLDLRVERQPRRNTIAPAVADIGKLIHSPHQLLNLAGEVKECINILAHKANLDGSIGYGRELEE